MSGGSRIGTEYPSEWKDLPEEVYGCEARQLTTAEASSYPLYYFVPTVTADSRYLVFHSERSGWVQLYRLDLESGVIVQLTDGRTYDAGWAFWSEYRLRGIFNHISVLSPKRGEVIYFEADEIRATHVGSLENRLGCKMPEGRISIGQTDVSPDGRWLALIHADEELYRRAVARRESLVLMGLWKGDVDHQAWRESMGEVALDLVDLETGEVRPVTRVPFHFHHVLFAGKETLVLNHPRGDKGMWKIGVDGSDMRWLRPHTDAGAHEARIIHQVVHARGVAYEAITREPGGGQKVYFGTYHLEDDTFTETYLPGLVGVHVGLDPEGLFSFGSGRLDGQHLLFTADLGASEESERVKPILKLRSDGSGGQRGHAHPFLDPQRKYLFFTDRCERGYFQVVRVPLESVVGSFE